MTRHLLSRLTLASSLIILTSCGGSSPSGTDIAMAPRLLASTSAVTLRFNYWRAAYEITPNGAGYNIRNQVTGEASTIGAEVTQLDFSDVSINLTIGKVATTISTADLNSIIELYIAFFNRIPDADGLAYWIHQRANGMSIDSISDSFYGVATSGTFAVGYTASMSNDAFVKIVYQNVLGKAADTDGLAYWTAKLASRSRGGLVRDMISSAHGYKNDPSLGYVPDRLDNLIAVGKFYAVRHGVVFPVYARSVMTAAKVTATDISQALAEVGLTDVNFNLYPYGLIAGSPYGDLLNALNISNLNGVVRDGRGGYYLLAATKIVRLSPDGTASIYIGSEAAGIDDGTGTVASFSNITDGALDATGNLYVADYGGRLIRKVTPTGVVTTIAGRTSGGAPRDGTGNQAAFGGGALGLALDRNGNILVADQLASAIRKVTPTGVVTTIAGALSVYSYADANSTDARFNMPTGIAVDDSGAIYIADTGNSTLRKMTLGGDVITVAGKAGKNCSVDGVGTNARLHSPSGITLDAAGALYIVEGDAGGVRKMSKDGTVTTHTQGRYYWNNDCSPGGYVSASFYNGLMHGIEVDGVGNLYLASREGFFRSTAGTVTALAGSNAGSGKTNGFGTNARFGAPFGLHFADNGNLYVADIGYRGVRAITPTLVVSTISTSPDLSNDSFFQPSGVVRDSQGNLLISDMLNSVVRKITPSGSMSILAGTARSITFKDGTGSAAAFYYLRGIAIDGADNMYVADSNNAAIRKVTSGGVVTTLTNTQNGSVSLKAPASVALDKQGNVYVADFGNHTIQRISQAGVVTTIAGAANQCGNSNGQGSTARFCAPMGIALDTDGNIYVADTNNHLVRKITPAGVVSTIAGTPGKIGNAWDGSTASLLFPRAITVSKDGVVYVAASSGIYRLAP